MIRSLILGLVVLLYFNSLSAQFTYFSNTYNPNNTWSIGHSILEYNGNYYISGASADSIFQYQSIFYGSVDSDGDLVFWRTYGGHPYAYWSGYTNSMISTNTLGELVLAGERTKSGLSNAIYYNFSSNGDTNFTTRYYDTTYLGYTFFNQCKQTTDGGLIFIGKMTVEQYNSDILLLKTDHSGQEQWRKHYGKPVTWSVDHGYNILETADSGFLIGYYFYIAGQEETGDPYIMKVDKLGNYEWELNLGGPFEDYLATVCFTNDGHFMCAASISDSASNDKLITRVHITKVSTDGEIIWAKTVGKRHLWNKVYGIYQAHDSGYIMCGKRNDSLGSRDFLNSSAWICKVDENGDSLWWREYEYFDDPEYHDNRFKDLIPTSDGGYIAVGETSTIYDPQQTWLLKVDSIGCDTPGCDQTVWVRPIKAALEQEIKVFPNPLTTSTTLSFRLSKGENVQFTVYNVQSRIVYAIEEWREKGEQQVHWNAKGLPAGMYYFRIQAGDKVGGGKMLKMD